MTEKCTGAAFGLPVLEHAAGAVPLPDPGEVLQGADYGVAGGNYSMALESPSEVARESDGRV